MTREELVRANEARYISKVQKIPYYDMVFERGDGALLYDTEGNEYIDLLSSAGSANTGNANLEIAEAVYEQMKKICQITPAYVFTEKNVELAKKLTEPTPGDFDKKVAFGLSGSNSIDGAIKLGKGYTKRNRLISFFVSVTGLNSTIGAILTVVVVAIIVLMGGEATIKSFAWTIPLMVAIGAVMAIIAFTQGDGSVLEAPVHLERAATPNWLIAPFVYVSYNTICSVCSLSPIGFEAKSRKDAVIGGVVGGATIGGLALLIMLGLLKNQEAMLNNDMPMYAMAVGMNKYLGWAYALMLMIAILTTAIALLFGLVERLAAYEKAPLFKNKKLVVVVISVLGLLGSFVGFTTLVGTLYPLSGYVGLLLIFALFYNYFRTGKIAKAEQSGKVKIS